jgi:hypothetical protein
MATLPVQIVSSLKRTLPFLHYSHESFLFFEVPLTPPQSGQFIFGYSQLDAAQIAQGIQTLAQVLHSP